MLIDLTLYILLTSTVTGDILLFRVRAKMILNQRVESCCHYHASKGSARYYKTPAKLISSKIWLQEVIFSEYDFLFNLGYWGSSVVFTSCTLTPTPKTGLLRSKKKPPGTIHPAVSLASTFHWFGQSIQNYKALPFGGSENRRSWELHYKWESRLNQKQARRMFSRPK